MPIGKKPRERREERQGKGRGTGEGKGTRLMLLDKSGGRRRLYVCVCFWKEERELHVCTYVCMYFCMYMHV